MVNNTQLQPSVCTCECFPIQDQVNVLLSKDDYEVYLHTWKDTKSVMDSEPRECSLPKSDELESSYLSLMKGTDKNHWITGFQS